MTLSPETAEYLRLFGAPSAAVLEIAVACRQATLGLGDVRSIHPRHIVELAALAGVSLQSGADDEPSSPLRVRRRRSVSALLLEPKSRVGSTRVHTAPASVVPLP